MIFKAKNVYKGAFNYRHNIFNFWITYCAVVLVHCSIFTFNSVIMDCIVAATNLKNLLVAHGNAEAQVYALGKLLLCSCIVLVNVPLIGNILLE